MLIFAPSRTGRRLAWAYLSASEACSTLLAQESIQAREELYAVASTRIGTEMGRGVRSLGCPQQVEDWIRVILRKAAVLKAAAKYL